MNLTHRQLRRLARALGLASLGWTFIAASALVTAGDAHAQARPERVRIIDAGLPDGSGNILLDTMRLGFRLFGNGDEAVTGMRATGHLGTYISNLGPCDHNQTFGNCHYQRSPFRFSFFEIPLMAGAPPTDFVKIARVHPDAARFVRGGGWTVLANGSQTGFSTNFQNGPADNSLGQLFAGATATEDGACTDNSTSANGFIDGGIQLLAGSDCPPTWAPSGFVGPRRIPQEGWEFVFNNTSVAQFDSGRFQWNRWQVPDADAGSGTALRDLSKFLGGFSTYGAISDYHSSIRPLYGGVIPGQSGDASVDGYPLGLRWEFEAFSFPIPAVASVVFWRALVINRSADVYGTGIDYDSLYLGVEPGTGNRGGGQAHSNYYLPQFSAGLYHQSGNTLGANCGPARTPPGVSGCATTGGYAVGADFVVVLKSPIGDLRNKLFTRRPGSGLSPASACQVGVDPFCDPTHADRGDTITINHGHMCGFGGCWANMLNVSDKRAFGLLASVEGVANDGWLPNTANTTTWRPFRNYEYPAVFGKFNKFIPGVHPWMEEGLAAGSYPTWDWNDDGQPDTLFFDTCHFFGCVATSQDTMPGGQVNAYGNIGGVLAAGPFKLAAGDTTEFFAAFIAELDSVRAWAAMDAATSFYQTFFLGPEAPPPARIISTAVRTAVDTVGEAQAERVQLFFSSDPEEWTDPFLGKLADDMEAAPTGTPLAELRDANTTFQLRNRAGAVVATGLVDALRFRASDNLEAIEVYKSCDGGGTFTDDGNCIGDPAINVDGTPSGLGWGAYAILRRDDFSGGDIPNVFTDLSVQGGNRYLYTLVGKTRGATFLLSQPDGTPDSVQFAPAVRNVLTSSTSDVQVAQVYVPATRQAGSRPATASFLPRPENSSVPFDVLFTDRADGGRYVAIFGNQVDVDEFTDASSGDLERSVVTVRTVITADVGGIPTPVTIREESFERAGDEPVALAGTPATSVPATNVERRTLGGLGFVLVRGTTVLFGSNVVTGAGATPTRLFGSNLFPGFTISVNNSQAGAFELERVIAVSATAKARLGTRDTVTTAFVNNQIVHWREGLSRHVGRGGRYQLTWTDEPFGLPQGLELNRTDPSATQAGLDNALAARVRGDTTRTDAATAQAVTDALVDAGLLPSGSPTVTLQSVEVPFQVRNVTFDRPVYLAMVERTNNTYLFGSANDTLRLDVPDDRWVPADQLVFLEDVVADQTTGNGVILGPDGQPVQETVRAVTFARAVLGCLSGSQVAQCNPVRTGTAGEGSYNPGLSNGDVLLFNYRIGITDRERIEFDVVPPVSGSAIARVTRADLSRVKVVPNPFVVFSTYQTTLPGVGLNTRIENPRVMFSSVPPSGTLRIYTVAGQFVQQIQWAPSDLNDTGDLFYDLRTREGTQIASGLYIWVLTTNVGGQRQVARGKFVVIQGTER